MLKAKVQTGAGNTAMATGSYRDGLPPTWDFVIPLKLELSVDQFAEFHQKLSPM